MNQLIESQLNTAVIGIELGSTRIKAVLIDDQFRPLANGIFEWENQLEDGIWTYALKDVEAGLQACFADLKADVKKKYGFTLHRVSAIGVSAMMHGYLPFDTSGRQLAGFRTWRNTITGEAARQLSQLFGFNIPQRWSIAHLYQAILNNEEHVKDLAFLTTLAGYIHWKLSGEKVIGIGDASGMFPIDSSTKDYDAKMLEQFRVLSGIDLRTVFPKVLVAGENAGTLTKEGALFLDPSGELEAGIPLAPCEGDAGTGMTATNSVKVHTGNVSAGTSDFAMIVVDQPLGVHEEIDMVTTPSGDPVAMVHCNNCTSDLNAWIGLFGEVLELMAAHPNTKISKAELFTKLFQKALEGDTDCGGLMNINYISGEGVTKLDEGIPLFLRRPDANFNLANFMRTQLISALATLKIGLDILTQTEHVPIQKLYGHGGFFKTPGVGTRLLSAAAGAPVAVMKTAGEGGPYGMALLAAYMMQKEEGESLADFLETKVFAGIEPEEVMATEEEIKGFQAFLEEYKKALVVEEEAIVQNREGQKC